MVALQEVVGDEKTTLVARVGGDEDEDDGADEVRDDQSSKDVRGLLVFVGDPGGTHDDDGLLEGEL